VLIGKKIKLKKEVEQEGYNKAPGSTYYMLFGDDSGQQSTLPYLNEDYIPEGNVQEIPLSQNLPAVDEM
jgi:hypothetical protein